MKRKLMLTLAVVVLFASATAVGAVLSADRVPRYQPFVDSGLQNPDTVVFTGFTLGLNTSAPITQVQDVLDAVDSGQFTATGLVLLRFFDQRSAEGVSSFPEPTDRFSRGVTISALAVNDSSGVTEIVQLARYSTEPEAADLAFGFASSRLGEVSVELKHHNGTVSTAEFNVEGVDDSLVAKAEVKGIPNHIGELLIDDPFALPLRVVGLDEQRLYTLGIQRTRMSLDPTAVDGGDKLELPEGTIDILDVTAAFIDSFSHIALKELTP